MIILNKTTQQLAGGPFGFALTNTMQTTGTVTTTVAGTPAQVDGDTSIAGLQSFIVANLGQGVSINESSLPAGSSLISASCTNSGGTVVGSLSGTTYTIPAASVTAAQAFTCTFVNVAPQPPFTCDSTMYLGVGAPTQLLGVNASTNPFTYSPIGSPYSPDYNAMGYDVVSNYLYAVRWDGTTYRLLRIGSDGTVVDRGAIAGGGINAAAGIATGVIGPDGYFYLKLNTTTNQMWRVDLSTRTATLITLSQSIAQGDWAWYNGLLYAHDHVTGFLNAVNPATGAVTRIGPSGISGDPDAFGSMISASNGVFGRRNSGGFFRFNTTTGAATLISDAPAGGGDGAKCPTSPLNFPADLVIAKDDGNPTYTPGNNVVYTIVVSNNGPYGVQNALVTDSLPTGVTTANWTCATTAGGGACGAASGTGAINSTVSLPVGASVTYTLTLFVPSTFSGDLINTATVTAPAGTIDSNTANNSDGDTDTQFPLPAANVANLSCLSDASLLNTAYDGAGGRLTSGTDTHWQVALTTTAITGAPPAGLSYGAAAVVTNPPLNYMVSPYNNANWISNAPTALHPGAGNYDIFYRYQANLLPGVNPSTLAPRLDFYSDNAVYQIWVNGVAQNIRSNYGAGDPYFYAGFQAGNPAAGTLVGPWNSGLNEIVVHIKSGPGAQAFLAQVVLPQSLCTPATVTLNKTTQFVAGGAFGFGLTNTSQATGTVTTSAANTPVQVDGDTASAGTTEPYSVATFGSDVVITESSLPAGWLLSDAACTSGGVAVGTRSGSAYTIPGTLIDSSAESFECTFTNTPMVNLRIDKAANPTTLRGGEPVTYTITLNNDGPGPGDGAVVTDPAIPGVDCSAGTLTCSNESGGAACPASLDVAAFQSTGLTIPVFPAGGTLQFGMTCTVTATGQ